VKFFLFEKSVVSLFKMFDLPHKLKQCLAMNLAEFNKFNKTICRICLQDVGESAVR
jgi:hypothetical protein